MTAPTQKKTCNTYTAQYLKKVKAARMKFSQAIEYDVRNIFLQRSCRILPKKIGSETSSRPIFVFLKSFM